MKINIIIFLLFGFILQANAEGLNLIQAEKKAIEFAKKGKYINSIKIYKKIINQYYDNQFTKPRTDLEIRKYVQSKINQNRRPSIIIWKYLKKIAIGYKLLIKKSKGKRKKIFKRSSIKYLLMYELFGTLKKVSPIINPSFMLLQKNANRLSLNTSYSFSDSLWIKGSVKRDYQGTDLLAYADTKAHRTYKVAGIKYARGLSDKIQIDINFEYVSMKLHDGDFFGAKKDEEINQIKKMSSSLSWSFYKNLRREHVFSLGYSHPGNVKERSPAFLSTNDFSQILEVGLKSLINFKKIILQNYLALKIPVSGNMHEQILFDIKTLYKFKKMKLLSGPGLFIMSSLSGMDILDSEFIKKKTQTGIFPLSEKKEQFLGLSLNNVLNITAHQNIDFQIAHILSGKNTGQETSFNLGYHFDF